MVRGRDLERLVRRLDRALAGLEREAIQRLDQALRFSALRLENDLKRLYLATLVETATEGAAMREARARVLLEQVRASLTVTSGASADDVFMHLVRQSFAAGIDNAVAGLSLYGQQAVALSSGLRPEVLAQATNAAARLQHHGVEFVQRVERSIIDGIARGQGWAKTAREVRMSEGILYHEAERIVRTESIVASDTARRETYQANGVEFVQRMATMDTRVCGFCASRAGNVYRADQAPAALHPNCRCYNAPWKREWQELGLTDDSWMREHKAETLERLAEAKRKPQAGAAPFERMAGEEPPEPVWVAESW